MNKIAQKRGLWGKIKEKTNIGGYASEKLNPEFEKIMEQLRLDDDRIRAIASGDQVGDAAAPQDSTSLKDLLKSVKSNINRREYMRAISDLGRFHKKMFDISNLLKGFTINVDNIHEKFLFGDLDDDSKKYLSYFKDKWAKKSNLKSEYFIKQANIFDFYVNFSTARGQALSAWEKLYPNKVKVLKHDTLSLLKASEKMLSILDNNLKDMETSRAKRNPDKYITSGQKIIAAFRNYDEGDSGFKNFYQKNVKDFLEKQEFFTPKPIETLVPLAQTNSPVIPDLATPIRVTPAQQPSSQPSSQPISSEPKSLQPWEFPEAPKSPQQPATPPKPMSPHPLSIPVLPPIPSLREPPINPYARTQLDKKILDELTRHEAVTLDDAAKVNDKIDIRETLPLWRHASFINSLESMSDESPELLSKYISKYAKQIFSKDPESSIKLFKIAASIKG